MSYVKIDTTYLWATISIGENVSLYHLEEVIVHELLHILIGELKDREDNLVEVLVGIIMKGGKNEINKTDYLRDVIMHRGM